MDPKVREILNILSEECAEVIQAISKCHRFGFDNHKPGELKSNIEHLNEELGDLLAMIDLLKEEGVVSTGSLNEAKIKKIDKLKKWSTIYRQAPNDQLQ